MPAVSFGLPVHNGERFLRQTLHSILNQTFTDFEVIVSDNASTDETPAVLAEFARRDSRICILRQPANIGAVQNFEAVRRAARGQFFAWAGDHDLYDRRWLEECVDALTRHPKAVLAYPWFGGISFEDRELFRRCMTFDTVGLNVWRRVAAIARMHAVGSRIYGCFRLEAMQRVPVHPSAWWDRLFLTSLAAHGEFVQIERVLWWRRYAEDPERNKAGLALRTLQHQFRTVHEGGRVPFYCRLPTLWHLVCLVGDLSILPADHVYTPKQVAVGLYAAATYLVARMDTQLRAEVALAFRDAERVEQP